MKWFLDWVYLLCAVFYAPILLYQMVFLGKNRTGWKERFGGVRRRNPATRRIWIHAVSLGEVNATTRLVASLRAAVPDCDIVVSATTDVGFARAVELFGKDVVFRFPLDFSFSVGRTLQRIAPTLIVLMELEVWPNLTAIAASRRIPVVVVNGRLTERSAVRFRWVRALTQPMFRRLRWVGAQDEAIAQRFFQSGALLENVQVTSSLKWDSASLDDCVIGAEELRRQFEWVDATPLWVCGSTGPGEEAIVLEAYRRLIAMPAPVGDLRLCIVPRKPERFCEVYTRIENAGFHCIRRSRVHAGESPTPASAAPPMRRSVWLGDTVGELRKFYSLSDVVFVGRSLRPMGGSDPMEVAALGKPMLCGPHMENFAEPVRRLQQAGVLHVVRSADDLVNRIASWLRNPSELNILGRRGRDVVRASMGATAVTVAKLVEIMNEDFSNHPKESEQSVPKNLSA